MSLFLNNAKAKLFTKRNKNPSIISIYGFVLALGISSGASIVWKNGNSTKLKTYIALILLVFALTIVNLSHLMFLPFGLSILTKKQNSNTTVLTTSKEDTPNTHLTIKMVIPLLISLTALLFKIKILFSMKNKFIPIIHKLCLLEKNLKYPLEKLVEEHRYGFALVTGVLLYSFPMQIKSSLINNHPMNPILFLVNIYHNYCSFTFEIQFCSLCVLMIRRFRTLNNRITTISVLKYDAVSLHRSRKDIQHLKDIHKTLIDVCQMIIDYFNVPIFITLTQLTINCFLNVYFAIFGGFKDDGSMETVSRRPEIEVVSHYLHASYFMGRFCLICIAADRMMREIGVTKICLADILSNNYLEEMQKEVKYFFNYAATRKLKFTICGLFELDISVITAALTTAVTYLVVLIQFHKV